MTMDSIELPSINSTTSISDNAALRNYYENLLFKNSSNKSLVDFQDTSCISNSADEKFHKNDIINNNNRVDFIKGFKDRTDSTLTSSATITTTSNSDEHVKNHSNNLESQQQQPGNADPRKRLNKVTFPSLQIISNESDSNSTEQSDDYDVSMFKPTKSSIQYDTAINQPNGRRQSIFKFSECTTETNNGIDTKMDSSDSSTKTTLNNQPITKLFNFNETINRKENVNNNTFHTPSNSNNMNMKDSRSIFWPNGQTLFANERRSSYISDSLINHDNDDNGNNSIFNNYQYGYIPIIQNRNNFNIMQRNYYEENYSNSISTMNRSNDNGLLQNNIGSQSPATLLNQMFNNTNNIHPSDTKTHTDGYPYSKMSNISSSPQNERYTNSTQNKYHDIKKNHQNDLNNPMMNRQRRKTQPTIPFMNGDWNLNGNANKSSQYRCFNYLNKPRYTTLSPTNNNLNGNNNLDNGLILLNTGQLTSSSDLHKIYEECGKSYFSSEEAFRFSNYIKSLLNIDTNNSKNNDFEYMSIKKSMLKFLSFLKSCNLNYHPQSDVFVSKGKGKDSGNGNTTSSHNVKKLNSMNNGNNSTSTYLHYKPLVLVSLKNGKLELLSIPSNSNLLMKRGDLIIVDGDRGKDLALVIEPTINLDMALMINFLKKKIHFDSLITNRDQHYPNEKFIDALVSAIRGLTDELDPKLYDVIELIQLVAPSKQIVRFATPWEVSTNLHNKFQDELKALHIAQLKLKSLNNHGILSGDIADISSRHVDNTRLNIKILNAEFQFDRKKLTFYYICEERNDFRELIKELFKYYKTRIWLCAIPNNLNIDEKYYDNQQYELKMYQYMMSHYVSEDLNDDTNFQKNGTGGFIVAPPLSQLKLDDFQIGVYKELVKALFSTSSKS